MPSSSSPFSSNLGRTSISHPLDFSSFDDLTLLPSGLHLALALSEYSRRGLRTERNSPDKTLFLTVIASKKGTIVEFYTCPNVACLHSESLFEKPPIKTIIMRWRKNGRKGNAASLHFLKWEKGKNCKLQKTAEKLAFSK